MPRGEAGVGVGVASVCSECSVLQRVRGEHGFSASAWLWLWLGLIWPWLWLGLAYWLRSHSGATYVNNSVLVVSDSYDCTRIVLGISTIFYT